MNAKIVDLKARYIYDSRGIPSVEADIYLSNGAFGRFSTPSGASKGSKEALELRDNGKDFHGFGVQNAIKNILSEIKDFIIGKSFSSQEEFDRSLLLLDGTMNKSRLGANAILPVSAAFYKAGLFIQDYNLAQSFPFIDNITHLPLPLINILNGGKHANNGISIQEFMIVPYGAKNFSQSLMWSAEIFYSLKDLLAKKGFSIAVGDEGGFAPSLSDHQHVLDFLCLAVQKSGFKLGEDVGFALDVAADSFFNAESKKYIFDGKALEAQELLACYENLAKNYFICSIEDPFYENDYESFKEITKKLGNKIQIVGDDLFVTKIDYLQKGIEENLANAILIKMNQIGTITETFSAINLAKKNNFATIASHRSGETEETFLADLAIISQTEQIKTGSMSRGERMAKYNRLLRIEETFGDKITFLGKKALKGKLYVS